MNLANSELLILKQLWRKQPLSLREIHLAVETELRWSRSSTRKTVERMVNKNMLSVTESHGLKIYRAKLRKIPTIAAMVRGFAANVLGMDGPLPVSNLVKSRLLTDEELEELDAYLKKLDTESAGHEAGKEAGQEAGKEQ